MAPEGDLWFADWGVGILATGNQHGLVRRRQGVESLPIFFDRLAHDFLVVVPGGSGLLLVGDTDW